MMELRVPVDAGEVVIRFPPYLHAQATFLRNLLEESSAEGLLLEDGTTIQCGWSLLRLQRSGSDLLVCEPDFSGDPLGNLIPQVTTTLTVQAHQNDILRLVTVEPMGVYFKDVVLVADGCLEQSNVYMLRMEAPDNGDSGWYIGYEDDPDEEYDDHYVPVYEIFRRRPVLLRPMLLPTGWMANFTGDQLDSIFDPANNEVWVQDEGHPGTERSSSIDGIQ